MVVSWQYMISRQQKYTVLIQSSNLVVIVRSSSRIKKRRQILPMYLKSCVRKFRAHSTSILFLPLCLACWQEFWSAEAALKYKSSERIKVWLYYEGSISLHEVLIVPDHVQSLFRLQLCHLIHLIRQIVCHAIVNVVSEQWMTQGSSFTSIRQRSRRAKMRTLSLDLREKETKVWYTWQQILSWQQIVFHSLALWPRTRESKLTGRKFQWDTNINLAGQDPTASR